jgi:SAM-dependent methyltransferase
MGRDGITAQFQLPAVSAGEGTADPGFGHDGPVGQIDGAAIAAVTNLYRNILPPGGEILDVLSGWVPHLPPEAPYRRVVGIGIERRALVENPFLDDWRVQDLNANPFLPFASGEFDGATICAAIQYLARPAEVLRDIARVLRPGAPLIVSFSNRCVATRAIGCWCLHDETGQLCLVAQHFAAAGNWADIRCLDCTPGGGQPLYAVLARSLGAGPPGASD